MAVNETQITQQLRMASTIQLNDAELRALLEQKANEAQANKTKKDGEAFATAAAWDCVLGELLIESRIKETLKQERLKAESKEIKTSKTADQSYQLEGKSEKVVRDQNLIHAKEIQQLAELKEKLNTTEQQLEKIDSELYESAVQLQQLVIEDTKDQQEVNELLEILQPESESAPGSASRTQIFGQEEHERQISLTEAQIIPKFSAVSKNPNVTNKETKEKLEVVSARIRERKPLMQVKAKTFEDKINARLENAKKLNQLIKEHNKSAEIINRGGIVDEPITVTHALINNEIHEQMLNLIHSIRSDLNQGKSATLSFEPKPRWVAKDLEQEEYTTTRRSEPKRATQGETFQNLLANLFVGNIRPGKYSRDDEGLYHFAEQQASRSFSSSY